MNKLRILCIDGGGLRGIIPLRIISLIEEITGKEIHHSFDVIAGTSTGALLACALSIKHETRDNIRKHSLKEIQNLYEIEGQKIFPKLNWYQSKIKSIFRPKFNPKPLNDVLLKYLDDKKISDSLKPLFIASYDLQSNNPVFFTTKKALIDYRENVSLLSVCRATSAAPTYLPTYKLEMGKTKYYAIDGGIFMNNPSMGVFMEVLSSKHEKYYNPNKITLNPENIKILSLGTGYTNNYLRADRTENWGLYKWAKPAIDLAMNAPSSMTEDHMKMIFRLFNCSDNYLRLDVNLDETKSEMSDSSKETRNYWSNQVQKQIIDNEIVRIKLEAFFDL